MQERRRVYEENPKLAWDMLEQGSRKAEKSAENTMQEVRDAMKIGKCYEPPSAGAVVP